MIFVIGGKLKFATDARRDAAITQLQAYGNQPAVASDLFVPANVVPYDGGAYKGWPHALNFEFRFLTQANRDNLWNQADARLGSGATGPVAGAFIYRLDSNADDPTQPVGTFSETRSY